MKTCTQCGKRSGDSAHQCKHCGVPFHSGPPPFVPPAAPAGSPAAAAAAKKKSNAVPGIAIAAGLGVGCLILVAVMGILAAIAVPKFASMLEKSREGATLGNISAIKSGISIYYGDHNGKWPAAIDKAPFLGEYMDSLPAEKVSKDKDGKQAGSNLVTSRRTNDGGWYYNPKTGEVRVNLAGTDSKGREYWNYGYE